MGHETKQSSQEKRYKGLINSFKSVPHHQLSHPRQNAYHQEDIPANTGEDGEREPLPTSDGSVSWCSLSHCGN